MPTAEILKTIVTPDGAATVVELQISDGSPPRADGDTLIVLVLKVSTYELPLVSHLQIAALAKAIALLTELKDRLERPLHDFGGQYSTLNPKLATPKT